MERSEIIKTIYANTDLRNVARRYAKSSDQFNDLWHLAMVSLCELPEEALKTIHENGRLPHYTYGIIRNQAVGKYTEFNQLYNSSVNLDAMAELINDDDEYELKPEENIYAEVLDVLDMCYYMVNDEHEEPQMRISAQVCIEYIKMPGKRSYRKLEQEIGIHNSSITQYMKNIRKALKQRKMVIR